MQSNKLFAVKRLVNYREAKYKWWCVIDCGETKRGGFTTGDFWNTHFSKDGKTYRWYAELFMPPVDLIDWQEIKTIDKTVTVVDIEGNAFEGWTDKEDGGLMALKKFAMLLGKELSIDEVKELIKFSQRSLSMDEAIQAMMKNYKITHRFFMGNEFFYMKEGRIYSEDGIDQSTHFYNKRKSEWLVDWKIYV